MDLAEFQKITDLDRYKMIDQLSEEEKETHDFIEKVLNEFHQRNIPAYIFAELPCKDEENEKSKKGSFQYNTLQSVLGYPDPRNPEQLLNIHEFNIGMLYHILKIFVIPHCYKNNVTLQEALEGFSKTLIEIYKVKNKLTEDEISNKLKKIIEDNK